MQNNEKNKLPSLHQLEQNEKVENQNPPQGLFWNMPRNMPQENGPDFKQFGRSDKDPFCGDQFGFYPGNLMGPEYFQNFGQQQQKNEQNPFKIPPGAKFDPFGPASNFNTSFATQDKMRPPFPPM